MSEVSAADREVGVPPAWPWEIIQIVPYTINRLALGRGVFGVNGDFDHIGSAAHLRKTFGAPIAMHENDVEMSANGDMFAGRNRPSWPVRTLASLALRLRGEDRFTPDVLLDEGCDLSEYGLAGAQVVLLRGHSAGSIALLLADGSLLCGDVLENRKTPRPGSIMDDPLAAKTSVERLGTMTVGTVYPGHGSPFEFREITAAHP